MKTGYTCVLEGAKLIIVETLRGEGAHLAGQERDC